MKPFTFHLIAHTHWDREWYLPRSAFVARLVPAMDDLLARLESEPCLRSFLLDGQTVIVEDYLRVHPERTDALRALVKQGRLQVGPWYVLADELIPSGESLVRNLLAGSRDARTLGRRTDVLYSPDAFGHPAVMPSLAREFGISWGVLWRGLGGEPGFDGDLYRWMAPDGRAILLHHLPAQGYEAGVDLPGERKALPAAWSSLRAVLLGRAQTSHVAVFVGADHHAVHPDLCRLRDLIAELEPAATVAISRLEDFFEAAADEAALVPAVRGELRWSYGHTWTLQGVHATRAALKRGHDRAELWLERTAEPLAALAAGLGRAQPGPVLRNGWRTLLRSQFHDSIAGCTSDAVATRVEARIGDAELIARDVSQRALDALTGNDPDRARDAPAASAPRLVLWNPVPRERSGVVVADLTWFVEDVLVGPPGARAPRRGPGAHSVALSGAGGAIPVQPLGRARAQERLDSARHYPDQDEVETERVAFHARSLGGFGIAALRTVPQGSRSPRGRVSLRGHTLANGLIEVTVHRDGHVRVLDRKTGQVTDGLLRVESGGDAGDTYTYAAPATDVIRTFAGRVGVRPLARGPLVGALEVTGQVRRGVEWIDVRLVLAIHDGSSTLRLTLEIDNQAADHRLRLRLPTGTPGISAIAGAAFGSELREPVRIGSALYPHETPVTTAPAHRFVATTGGRGGLALFAPGFFEYELTPDGDLLFTVLRAVGELSRGDLPSRRGHAGWPTPTPGAQGRGKERLQLALAHVRPADLHDSAHLTRMWEDVFLPLRAIWLRQASPLDIASIDFRLSGDGIVFSALKPAESGEGIVLRCYNARSTSTDGVCRVPFPLQSAERTQADERPGVALPIDSDGRTMRFTAQGRELVTLLLRPDLPPPGTNR